MTIQERLRRHQIRSTVYWRLREVGFTNIEAENFIAVRMHWFN